VNIFETLTDIICYKKNRLADNIEDETEFIPFMVQKWLSFHSNINAEIVNVTTNRMWKSLGNDKQLWYKFYTAIIPRSTNKHTKYIKKAEKTKEKKIDDALISMLASRFELSKREIKLYIEDGKIDISKFKKSINS
jgi:ribosomal protein L20A (L18A)